MSNAPARPGISVGQHAGLIAAVTGATGFIGSRLVEVLAEHGAEVTCLIRGNQAGMRLHRVGAHIRKLDLTDVESLRTALQGVDVVFHLAYDYSDTAWNHKALRTLIEACSATGCRLVYASSFVVYELPDEGSVSEESPRTSAADGYSHTKLALETELLNAVRDKKLSATVVQPTIVYGPYSRLWTIDPAAQLRYGTVVLPDAGEGFCNAVYIDDVADAMLLAASSPVAIGQRYLISGASPVTWSDFYEGIARAVGAKGPKYLPADEIKRAGGRVRKLFRAVTNPKHVIRKVASLGLSRKLMASFSRFQSPKVQHWLSLPMAEWRGHVHRPTPSHCRFLQARMTVDIDKARKQLGYNPVFSFDEGMIPTTRFLKKYDHK